MDKRKYNGGSRKGSGRKKGTGLSSAIKKHVDNFMEELIKDKEISNQLHKDLVQLSITLGWIYIIKDNDKGLTKIGVTQKENPKQRLSQYSSHNIQYDLIYIEQVEDCYELENEVHISMEEHRVKGDWFDVNEFEILEIIKTINKHKYIKIYGQEKI